MGVLKPQAAGQFERSVKTVEPDLQQRVSIAPNRRIDHPEGRATRRFYLCEMCEHKIKPPKPCFFRSLQLAVRILRADFRRALEARVTLEESQINVPGGAVALFGNK